MDREVKKVNIVRAGCHHNMRIALYGLNGNYRGPYPTLTDYRQTCGLYAKNW